MFMAEWLGVGGMSMHWCSLKHCCVSLEIGEYENCDECIRKNCDEYYKSAVKAHHRILEAVRTFTEKGLGDSTDTRVDSMLDELED